jgi:hypothetical protein
MDDIITFNSDLYLEVFMSFQVIPNPYGVQTVNSSISSDASLKSGVVDLTKQVNDLKAELEVAKVDLTKAQKMAKSESRYRLGVAVGVAIVAAAIIGLAVCAGTMGAGLPLVGAIIIGAVAYTVAQLGIGRIALSVLASQPEKMRPICDAKAQAVQKLVSALGTAETVLDAEKKDIATFVQALENSDQYRPIYDAQPPEANK